MSILVLTSDTLIGTPATGNLEYNGQFFGTDSNASRAQLQRIVQATAVASTSGTAIDFTNLPAWVKKITVMFQGVSTNGSSIIQVQLGTGSTTYTTTGYVGGAWTANTTNASSTTGMPLTGGGAGAGARVFAGTMTISTLGSNNWASSVTVFDTQGAASVGGSSIALAAALTAVRITTVNGTDTFDAGSVNLLYEG